MISKPIESKENRERKKKRKENIFVIRKLFVSHHFHHLKRTVQKVILCDHQKAKLYTYCSFCNIWYGIITYPFSLGRERKKRKDNNIEVSTKGDTLYEYILGSKFCSWGWWRWDSTRSVPHFQIIFFYFWLFFFLKMLLHHSINNIIFLFLKIQNNDIIEN